MNAEDEHLIKFKMAVKVLESYRKSLSDAGADPEIVKIIGSINRYLFNMPDQGALKVIHGARYHSLASARRLKDAPRMSQLTLDEVESLVSSDGTPRALLESIAVGRFQVPKGSLRSSGNLEQLREKILTMARNERAHATIAEVAKDGR